MNQEDKYSSEVLEDIMLDAKHGFSLTDIALRIGIPYLELYSDYCNPDMKVKLYYDAGRALGMVETDKTQFELAKNGSSSAKYAYDRKMINAHLSNVFNEIDNS